ncbi:MAG: hypothetical protein AAGA23_00485 [Pseudomonadota bacterium]
MGKVRADGDAPFPIEQPLPMTAVWFAQLFLLPVQIGWAALYLWSGRQQPRRGLDLGVVLAATGLWLALVFWLGPTALEYDRMWAVILTTTAGFLGFNAVLALGAVARRYLGPQAQASS